jgi:hypothetical protein
MVQKQIAFEKTELQQKALGRYKYFNSVNSVVGF